MRALTTTLWMVGSMILSYLWVTIAVSLKMLDNLIIIGVAGIVIGGAIVVAVFEAIYEAIKNNYKN